MTASSETKTKGGSRGWWDCSSAVDGRSWSGRWRCPGCSEVEGLWSAMLRYQCWLEGHEVQTRRLPRKVQQVQVVELPFFQCRGSRPCRPSAQKPIGIPWPYGANWAIRPKWWKNGKMLMPPGMCTNVWSTTHRLYWLLFYTTSHQHLAHKQ